MTSAEAISNESELFILVVLASATAVLVGPASVVSMIPRFDIRDEAVLEAKGCHVDRLLAIDCHESTVLNWEVLLFRVMLN